MDTTPQKLEGWLLKKGAKGFGGNAFKKRWFSLQGNRLYYYQNKGDASSLGYVDVMTATAIIPSGVKRNCEFQIVTPGRVYTLQAATESAMNEWVNALNTYRRHVLRKSGMEGAAPPEAGARPRVSSEYHAGDRSNVHDAGFGSRAERRSQPVHMVLGSRGASAYAVTSPLGGSDGGAAAAAGDVVMENQRLQLLLSQTQEQLNSKAAELNKLKDTLVSELRSLAVKQGMSQEELEKVRDELNLAQKMVLDLKKKEEEGGGGGGGGDSGEVQRLKRELEERDKQIEEQRVRIEVLKTKLEQRIEEEANIMKERVKETMGRLRKEHEEQLKKVRGEGGGAAPGDSSLAEEVKQLRQRNQELEAKLGLHK